MLIDEDVGAMVEKQTRVVRKLEAEVGYPELKSKRNVKDV